MPIVTRVFVSHSFKDATWCHAFVATLRRTEADVWYDEHNLGYGQLMNEIERELRSRLIFIAILSPTAVSSKWVQREVNAAIELADHDAQRMVLPVMAVHCDIPLFWKGYKRICGPNDSGMAPEQAAERVIHMLTIHYNPPVASKVKEEARKYARYGNDLHVHKRYEEAVAAFDHALTLDPYFVSAWQGKGYALTELGRIEEALIALERATTLFPGGGYAWLIKGNLLYSLKRFEEALTAYDRATVCGPGQFVAWDCKIELLRKLGRQQEALKAEQQLAVARRESPWD